MIPVNELRIGNWVQIEINAQIESLVNREPIQSKGVLFRQIQYFNIEEVIFELNRPTDGSRNINEIKPIPLTEEILLKSGFKIIQKDEEESLLNHLKIDEFGLDRLKFGEYRCDIYIAEKHSYKDHKNPYYRYYTVEPHVDLTSLHQLQNLYFALTGKELEIKL